MSALAHSSSPYPAAKCSAVRPSSSASSTLAPASSRRLSISTSPALAAACRFSSSASSPSAASPSSAPWAPSASSGKGKASPIALPSLLRTSGSFQYFIMAIGPLFSSSSSIGLSSGSSFIPFIASSILFLYSGSFSFSIMPFMVGSAWIMVLPNCSAICINCWFWNMDDMASMYFEGSIPGPPGPPGPGKAARAAASPPGGAAAPGGIIPENDSCNICVTCLKAGSFAICSAICLIEGSFSACCRAEKSKAPPGPPGGIPGNMAAD
mmetsp:Transcript_37034/g.82327  ORF Transcript_37034/g.82327 Transcript_37034/m.82327 type:complete len:267 (+) Transcript_37034:836-1636(+)